MLRLVRFQYIGSTYALVAGMNVYDQDDWDFLQRAIRSKTILYMGSISGKHSEVDLDLGSTNVMFEVLSEDQELIAKLLVATGGSTNILGYCLVSKLQDQLEEEAASWDSDVDG